MNSYLVYVSKRAASCTDDEIQNILNACERNNTHSDATGVLLYSDKKFIQYLEGDYRKITSLYDKIKTDSRHEDVILIQMGQTSDRLFPSWQMGAKRIDENEVDFHGTLDTAEAGRFRDILNGKVQTDHKSVDVIRKFFL